MSALRLLLATIIATCLVIVATRGLYDGVTVIGLIALAAWLGSYGVFTRDFWSRPARGADAADLSRLDRLDGRR